jgi:uncharacterized RDD family membrane protein YckC
MLQPPPPASWAPPVQTGPAPGVNYGGAGARLIAYIVDGFIMGLVYLAFFIVGGVLAAAAGSSNNGAGAGLALVVILIAVIVLIAWKPYFWTHGGQTPGYKILRLRVVRAVDGGPISTGQAVGRLLSYIVSGFLYLGFIWILFDSRRQGWHDKLANTVVIEA